MNRQTATELAVFVTAVACMAYGAWQIYPPAGWLAVGAILLFAGWKGVEG